MKYAPKKVFVLEDGEYIEVTYTQLCQEKARYAGRRFLPLHGMLMEVSEVDYKEFYREQRRQKYLNERSNDNGDFSYDMLTTDEFNGEDILIDTVSDTQGQAERNLLVDRLRKTLQCLSEDEQELIALHFQQGFPQVDLAKILGINQSSVSRRISKAVEKLKFLMKI